jgi:hypothetical protein
MNTFVTKVTSYNPKTGAYFIRPGYSALDTEGGMEAYVLSPFPSKDGSGIKSAPIAPRDSTCLVLKDGNRHYILGFLQPKGIVVKGDTKPSRDIEPGAVLLTHNTPSVIGMSAIGTILHIADKWAQAALNPLTQQLTAWFRNIRINLYSGIMEYFYDLDKKSGTFRITATKSVDLSDLPIPPPDGSSPLPQDRFTLKAGQLDDSHIIELFISQNFPSKGAEPLHGSTTQIGTKKDGTYFNHSSKTTNNSGTTTNMLLSAKDDGTFHSHYNSTNGSYVDTLVDTVNQETVKLDINGKAVVTIDVKGNVKIATVDGANILLGGTGKEQQLVTKSFIDKYYEKHTHSNGNQGAPTGPPMVPVSDIGIDSSTGPLTFTTKAE